LALDKNATKVALSRQQLPVAAGVVLARGATAQTLAAALRQGNLAPPLAVKPNSRGSSVGVTIVKTPAQILPAVHLAGEYDTQVLLEEFVPGVEITAGMVDGAVLPLVELRPPGDFYDYQAKYFTATTTYFCPARLAAPQAERLRHMAQTAWQTLGLRDLARIDFIVGETREIILEVNTLPGFTPHSLLPKAAAAAGMDFTALCEKIIATALARKKHG
jgi:D-alanine-D-alanine ligase